MAYEQDNNNDGKTTLHMLAQKATGIRAFTSIRPNFSIYFTLKTYFSILHNHISETPASVYLFYKFILLK